MALQLAPPAQSPEPRATSGQIMLEVAIAMVSVVAFLYILLNVWTWLNTSIAQRQAAFQETRRAAGRVDTAGQPVPYKPAPIQLVGPPGSGSVIDPWQIQIPPPPCDAANPFFEQAQLRLEEARVLQTEVEALNVLIEEKDDEVQRRAERVEYFAGDNGDGTLQSCLNAGHTLACTDDCGRPDQPCTCPVPLQNLRCARQRLERSNEELQELLIQLQDTLTQMQLKLGEMQRLIQEGVAACVEAAAADPAPPAAF